MNPSPARPSALIAEDEPLLAQSLQADLARLWPDLAIAANVRDGVQALAKSLALMPQVCFLDIRMPGLSGLDVAQALAEDWPENGPPFPLLVFITAYDEYAIQAFSAQAVDYLLKPVQPERLALCVERLRSRLAQWPAPDAMQIAVDQLRAMFGSTAAPRTAAVPRLDVIQAGVGSTVHMVPVDEVVYFEAADKYLRVVTADRDHLIRLSLKELIPQLDPQRYWQIHRGIVVQARMIQSAQREDTGKVTLTLRSRPEKIVASRLYAHLFKGM